MNLLEVGALLKRERERRGISIRDVMDATKISRRNLTAIEEGQVKALPHPVYLKGYVRNIAMMVGLDADELAQVVDLQYDAEQAQYLPSALPAAPAASPPATGAQAAPAPRPDQPMSPVPHHAPEAEREAWQSYAPEPLVPPKPKAGGALRSVLVLVLLVAALIGLLVQYQRMRTETPPAPVPAALPVGNATNATDQENATSSLDPGNATVEAAQPEPVSAAASAAPPVQESKPAAAPAPGALAMPTPSVPTSSIEVSRQTPSIEARTPGLQQLTITAKENEVCWVEVNDGRQARSFTLRNGESRQVEFASRMRVRLGNAGGVLFRLNGQDHPYEGKRGSIETVEFGTR